MPEKVRDVKMKSIVQSGLIGLANAGRADGGHWFVGHFGAEVLSLSLILMKKCVQPSAEAHVIQRVETLFDKHPLLFEAPLAGTSNNNEYTLTQFEEHIEDSASILSVDGHRTIYAALALEAFRAFPDLATPPVLEGLIGVLESCQKAGSDRYYGLDQRSLSDETLVKKYSFANAQTAAEFSLTQHRRVIADGKVDNQHFFFSGSRLHLVTHAQAILALDQLGYKKLVRSALKAYAAHCICINASAEPEGVKPYRAAKTLDPRDTSFWKRGKTNPHHSKLAYSTLEIFKVSPECDQRSILDDLSSYWEFYD